MNLLANENFPLLAVEALRDAGHDVRWARTDMAGAPTRSSWSVPRTKNASW